MQDALDTLSVTQAFFFLLYCLVIYILVRSVRRPIELKWPKLVQSHLWTDTTMHTAPAIVGALLALPLYAAGWPFPDPVKAPVTRMFYGLVAGFFSSWGYKMFRGVMKAKAKKLAGGASESPKSDTTSPPES